MKNIYIVFILFLGFSAYSQGENDNWYFGNKAAVNFSGAPVALTNSVMNAPEACGSISDAQGNLLFYTDGMTIWNRDHKVMQNGTGLAGTVKSAQVQIIGDLVKKERYYVFTTANSYSNLSYTAYSVVDMTLGSLGVNLQPLGGVVSTLKNIPVLDNNGQPITTGAVTAVPHANGTDFWILIPTHKDLLAFLFDSSGLATMPVVNTLFPFTSFPYRSFYVKASPKLSYPVGFDYIVAVGMGHNLEANELHSYGFDSNTGTLSNLGIAFVNAQNLRINPEFNTDGTILYYSSNAFGNAYFYKYDIINNNHQSIPTIIPGVNSGQLQRNKNGEIYISIDGAVNLAEILNPNSFPACNINATAISLSGQKSLKGLPQLFPEHAGCVNDIVLVAPETNNNYTYHANNSITTQTNYSINTLNIDMRAGNNILLLPHTEIGLGSNYTAVIEDCPVSKPSKRYWTPPAESQIYTVATDNDISALSNDSKVYPNPTTSSFTIDVGTEFVGKWELFDLSGKLVLQGKEPVGSVEGLAKATYVLKISLKNKEVKTHKIIVK